MLSREEILNQARAVVQKEGEAVISLADQFDDTFVQAVEKILACSGHVLVAGSGTSHAVAYRLAHLLSCCGTPALFIHPGDAQHGGAGAVTAQDVVIVISKGGETVEVNHLVRISKERGATVIALTEKPNSTLAQMSDVVVRVHPPAEIDPYGMIATGSSLFNSAWGDALCVVLLKLRGYTREQFGQTHPGGAVGKKIARESQS